METNTPLGGGSAYLTLDISGIRAGFREATELAQKWQIESKKNAGVLAEGMKAWQGYTTNLKEANREMREAYDSQTRLTGVVTKGAAEEVSAQKRLQDSLRETIRLRQEEAKAARAEVQEQQKQVRNSSSGIRQLSNFTSNGFASASLASFGFQGAQTITNAAVNEIKAAKDAYKDFYEQADKTSRIFKESSASVLTWSENSAKALAMSKTEAIDAASNFGILFNALGEGREKSAQMSMRMVQLAADLSSLKNIPIAEALSKLKYGLEGQTRPLRDLGISVDDFTLKQTAFDLKLTQSTTGTLPPLIRRMAVYQQILEQTKDAQGNLAATFGSLANQERVLEAESKNLQIQLGEKLMPVFIKVAKETRDWVEILGKADKAIDVMLKERQLPNWIKDWANGLEWVYNYDKEVVKRTAETTIQEDKPVNKAATARADVGLFRSSIAALNKGSKTFELPGGVDDRLNAYGFTNPSTQSAAEYLKELQVAEVLAGVQASVYQGVAVEEAKGRPAPKSGPLGTPSWKQFEIDKQNAAAAKIAIDRIGDAKDLDELEALSKTAEAAIEKCSASAKPGLMLRYQTKHRRKETALINKRDRDDPLKRDDEDPFGWGLIQKPPTTKDLHEAFVEAYKTTTKARNKGIADAISGKLDDIDTRTKKQNKGIAEAINQKFADINELEKIDDNKIINLVETGEITPEEGIAAFKAKQKGLKELGDAWLEKQRQIDAFKGLADRRDESRPNAQRQDTELSGSVDMVDHEYEYNASHGKISAKQQIADLKQRQAELVDANQKFSDEWVRNQDKLDSLQNANNPARQFARSWTESMQSARIETSSFVSFWKSSMNAVVESTKEAINKMMKEWAAHSIIRGITSLFSGGIGSLFKGAGGGGGPMGFGADTGMDFSFGHRSVPVMRGGGNISIAFHGPVSMASDRDIEQTANQLALHIDRQRRVR